MSLFEGLEINVAGVDAEVRFDRGMELLIGKPEHSAVCEISTGARIKPSPRLVSADQRQKKPLEHLWPPDKRKNTPKAQLQTYRYASLGKSRSSPATVARSPTTVSHPVR